MGGVWCVWVLAVCVHSVLGSQGNFCRALEDYGPRTDTMEERRVCQTRFEKECQPVTVSDCIEVTDLSCQVNLFTNCFMDWQMKESLESLMSVSSIYVWQVILRIVQ